MQGGGIIPGPGVRHLEYWSLPFPQAQLGAAPVDLGLTNVNVNNLPIGVRIIQVLAFFRFRAVENTNALANAIDGLQFIQLQPTGGAWVNAIQITDNLFAFAAAGREPGFTLVGDLTAALVVNADDDYAFQWEQGLVDVNFLNFDDYQTGLKIFYI